MPYSFNTISILIHGRPERSKLSPGAGEVYEDHTQYHTYFPKPHYVMKSTSTREILYGALL